MQRRTFIAAGVGVGAVALAGCVGSGSGLSEDDYDIGMSSSAFLKPEYEVAVGETVVWGNTSSRAHSVTAYEAEIPDGAAYFASGGFESESDARDAWFEQKGRSGGKIFTGETYEHTFEVPGRYRYFCIPHEAPMKGTITVTE